MWKRIDVVFTLKSPLHIGYLPGKGSIISRTRYYVPGKNFWGAVTVNAVENLFNSPDAESYREIGDQIKNNFKFMYFYISDGETKYTPEFTNDGLKYGKIDVFRFENKFINSRVLTEINHDSLTAKDKRLHEIEFINNKYQYNSWNTKNTQLLGCIWIKDKAVLGTKEGEKKFEVNEDGIFVNRFNLIEKLKVGGEQNYGFGRIELESINKKSYPIDNILTNDNIIKVNIKEGDPILSHLKYNTNIAFQGDLELLSGREYQTGSKRYQNPGAHIAPPAYYLSPGTKLISIEKKSFILNWNGMMRMDNDNNE